jgi:hypothetical protein
MKKIMKNRIYKYILSAICLILSCSCNNDSFFELSRSPEFPWQSVAEYEKSAIGAYNSFMRSNDWWGAIPAVNMCMDFVMSENARFVVGSVQGFPDQIVNGRKFGVSNYRVDGSFQRAYQTIAECNTGLEFYENNNGNPYPNATAVDKKDNVDRIAGELYCLRACAYFFLVNYYHPPYNPGGSNDFKGLPYRPKLSSSMNEALNPEFYTTEQFYQAIVADLKKAKELLPEKFNASTMNAAYKYGRLTKFGASAILARVYMMMGKLTGQESAEAEYDYIIGSGQFKLEKEPITNFRRGYNNYKDGNSEIIWEYFNANQSGGAALWGELSHYSKCTPFRNDNQRRNPLFTPVENFQSTGGRGNNWDWMAWSQYSISHKALKAIGWMNEDNSLGDAAKKDKRFQQLYYYIKGYKANIDKTIGEDTLYLNNAWASKETEPTIWVDKAFRGIDGMMGTNPIIRYAEVLINRAAIRFSKGDKQGAADDLNLIRERAWADPSVSYRNSSAFLTASNITEDIIVGEHIKELTGEGCWFNFEMAFKRPIGQPDIPNAPAAVNPPYSDMYWMIPASETMFYNSTTNK